MVNSFLRIPSFILIVGLSVCIAAGTQKKGIYYVSPTEQLSSCPGNSGCPPGQLCHTIDYLAEHSSEFFSPDQVNVTLIFMCGVHNYTKDLTVQNLHSFVMKGAAESRENVIIDHNRQFTAQLSIKPSCTIVQFFNISSVNITTLTMRCPSMNLKESHITVESSSFYGHANTMEGVSFINITGRGSRALLDNCTFTENCFIVSNFSSGIIVSNSTFKSYIYRHGLNSMIMALSSVVTLAGNVEFTDSSTGVHRLISIHPGFKSSINITMGATVHFIGLSCKYYGASVYGENGIIHIGAKAKVVFKFNKAHRGGAVYLKSGMIIAGAQSQVAFVYSHIFYDGGAIWLSNGSLIIDTNASLIFSHNHAGGSGGAVRLLNGKLIINADASLYFSSNLGSKGGAVYLENSSIYVNTTNSIHFYGNIGTWGGAMYFIHSTMNAKYSKSVNFTMNKARVQGGAIYIESGVYSSVIVDNSSDLLFFNNSAYQGGALYVISPSFLITVGYQSFIQFLNNTAFDVGGAVYSEIPSAAPCLFIVTDYTARVSFIGNNANHSIGHHMYGTSVRASKCDREHMEWAYEQGKPYCWHKDEQEHIKILSLFDPGLKTLSPVSSAPRRVCLCDTNGKPQCTNISQIITHTSIYRGETFTLSAHVVGYDLGTTVGVVHAEFLHSNSFSRLAQSEGNQPADNGELCTELEYTVFTKYDTEFEVLLLQTTFQPASKFLLDNIQHNYAEPYKKLISHDISDYLSHCDMGCLSDRLLNTPVIINITFIPGCPLGLTISRDHTTCSCYPVLSSNGFKCSIRSKTGFLQWNSTVWVNATFNETHSTGIIYNRFCPLNYCKSGDKIINIGDEPNKQCASNRTGILCGACMENFSLAIGSSRCIECPNNHNVALILAFAAAGIFLVFFVLALNLTVTQGFINGLIFYANIIWAYKIILFPSSSGTQGSRWLIFLQVFIAWLNLDFGIDSCFFIGLNAYWKTWLQCLFPFYIWAIAGAIIVACRHSSFLTELIGNRAVPLLATLILLSYMKLLRIVVDATSVAMIAEYPQNTSYAVWYLDGNLRYGQHPHIYLFIAAIAVLVFLWLPYTLLLLFIQPLRRVSHLRPLKWINKLAPVYDAHFSPLKDKHQYWFGAMLLVRGILLVLLTITSVANPELNVFILFQSTAFLFFFVSIKNVYKRMTVRVLESATLLNLIVLSAGTLYMWESTMVRMTILEISIGITFVQFCVAVVLSLIKLYLSAGWRCRQNRGFDIINVNIDDEITHERIEDPELEPLIH